MDQQEVIFKLSMFEQQMQQLQQQLQAVERGINELETLNLGLDDIKGSEGKEIFAQVGRGIYVKAKVISDELMVNVGEKNLVKRSVPEAKELILGQIKKLKDVEADLERTIEMTNSEFTELIQEYQKNQGKE